MRLFPAGPPPDTPFKQRVDRIAYGVAIVGPLTTVPQIVQIFSTRSAEDVSITAWVGFSLYSAFWVLYGWVHRDLPLTLANLLWTVLQLMVLAGAILYGGTP
ncbi:MAG: SemiSWEET family transporter [Candidatus Eremiobacterota bacterium]